MRALIVMLALAACAPSEPPAPSPRPTASRSAVPRVVAPRVVPAPSRDILTYCNLARPVETDPSDFFTAETQASVDQHNAIWLRVCKK